MKNTFSIAGIPARRVLRLLSAAMIASPVLMAGAQRPSTKAIDAQREAMRKVAFLAGHWSGHVSIFRGPGEPLHLTQTEDIQFKLGGLVLLIEGRSTGADGKAQFEALATVVFDDAACIYHIRVFHDGNFLDAPLTVLADGFSWGYSAGPAKILNTMRLTAKGEWQEKTEVTFGNNPSQPSVEMLLTRKQ